MNAQKKECSGNAAMRLIKGRRKEGPICSSPLVTTTLEQMKISGFYYPTAHNDARAMAMLSSAVYTSIGFQGIRVPFDLCVEAEAFGCKLQKGDKESPPSIMEKAFEENKPLTVPEDIFRKGRFKVVFEAIRILKNEFGNEVPIFAGAVGPLTLVNSLYDTSSVMRWFVKDPQRMDVNLERAAQFLAEYAGRLFDAGASVLAVLEPVASGNPFNGKSFPRHMIPVYQEIRKRIQGPVILHICGYTVNFLKLLPQTGFEAFSFEGPKVSVKTARRKIGDRMLLVGNIPAYDILLFGTPDEVREASLKALGDGVDMLAPSCGVPIQTPTENLRAMVRAVEEYRDEKAGK